MSKTAAKPRPKRPAYTVIYTAKVQQTGTRVSLIDNRNGKFAKDGEPWATLCEEHGKSAGYPTRADAHLSKTVPAEWCASCKKAVR